MAKRIAVVGTNHLIQWKDFGSTTAFKSILAALLTRHSDIQVIFEEWGWRKTRRLTVGHTLADEHKLTWDNVGTPNEPEYQNSGSLDTAAGTIDVYSPISTQSNREAFMLDRIQQVMRDRNAGMFIVGLAHLQSMAEKLIALGFEIEAYEWQAPSPSRLVSNQV